MSNLFVKAGHQLLKFDFMYDFYQELVGGVSYRAKFVKKVFSFSHENILDLGSGTSEIASSLESHHRYAGLDFSEKYLTKASKRNRKCKSFDLYQFDLSKIGWAEVVRPAFKTIQNTTAVALGLLHHMNDEGVGHLLNDLRSLLENGGKIFTVDPIITNSSTPLAKWFAMNDRGQYVRDASALEKLFSNNGFEVEYELKSKQFRIPLDTIEITAWPK